MNRMMTAVMRRMLVGVFALCASQVAAGSKPKEQTRMPNAYLCAQTQMIGHAGNSFATQALCNAARNGLERDAKDDGVSQCSSFCRKLSCNYRTQPDPLTATFACKGPDPAAQQWYGTAATPSFECKCSN